jgi:hypothetical protein
LIGGDRPGFRIGAERHLLERIFQFGSDNSAGIGRQAVPVGGSMNLVIAD